MSTKTQHANELRDETSPSAPSPAEQNVGARNTFAPPDSDALLASSEMLPEIEFTIRKHAGPEVSSDPSTMPRSKKTTFRPKAKGANFEESAGSKQGAAANPVANDVPECAAAREEAPDLTSLLPVKFEASSSPPGGTLPPALEGLFSGGVPVATLLAATSAAAGHLVRFDNAKNSAGEGMLALRIAIVGREQGLPRSVEPTLHAAYQVEAQEVQDWGAAKQKAALQGAADAARWRLYRQTLANAGILGLAKPSDGTEPQFASIAASLPRPRFVLRDPGQTDVKRGLETASNGLLIVDGRRMPTMAGFGVNYDAATADLLNAAAAGRPLELADPRTGGCVRMRPVAVSVIGTLTNVDAFNLHKAGAAALAATIFVSAEAGSQSSTADAAASATETLARVRTLATSPNGARLRLSTSARKAFDETRTNFVRTAATVLSPLSSYYAAAADLVLRITGVLHVLDCAVCKADQLASEVGEDVVLRAVAYVEQSVSPSAQSFLAPASVTPVLRDARRIVSFAQQHASAAFPLLARRDVIRTLQRSMSVAEVDHAIGWLVAEALLAESNPDASSGGHVFQVHPAVFDENNQLPDLITDPRRPKQ